MYKHIKHRKPISNLLFLPVLVELNKRKLSYNDLLRLMTKSGYKGYNSKNAFAQAINGTNPSAIDYNYITKIYEVLNITINIEVIIECIVYANGLPVSRKLAILNRYKLPSNVIVIPDK